MAGMAAIETILLQPTVSGEDLEQLLGWLNHMGFIIQLARHFTGCLWEAQYAAKC
jgi:hypothetical protein